MAVIRPALLIALQFVLGGVLGLLVLAGIRFVMRWPARPPHHAAREMRLPIDLNDADWAAWEAELRQSEEAEEA